MKEMKLNLNLNDNELKLLEEIFERIIEAVPYAKTKVSIKDQRIFHIPNGDKLWEEFHQRMDDPILSDTTFKECRSIIIQDITLSLEEYEILKQLRDKILLL